jgi:hypothetical protein
MWSSAYAQAETGSSGIIGSVTDSFSSTGIAGALITIVSEVTGLSRTVVTNESGMYEAPFLAAGRYTVRAEHPGFATVTTQRMELVTRQVGRVDFELMPSTISTEVVIDSGRSSPTMDIPETGRSISREEVAALPLSGRDFASLQILAAGVQPGSNVGGFAGRQLSEGFRVAGGTMYSGSFSVEQADNNRGYYYGSAWSPSLEMIREVRIRTAGISAQYGGGAYHVDVALNGGGRNLHGSLFEYIQHDKMSAPNAMSGADSPHLRRSQYGASISGPLKKDRLFIFGAFEGIRQGAGELMTTQVATLAQRSGLFPLTGGDAVTIRDPVANQPFPGNQIPDSRLSPLARYFLDNIWPLPNSGTQFYREQDTRIVDSKQFAVKMDYSHDKFNTFSLQVSRQKLAFDERNGQSLVSPRIERFDHLLGSIRYTRTLGSGMVNSLLLSGRRGYNSLRSYSDLVDGSSLAEEIGMTLGGATGTGYPLISISGRGFSGRTGQLNTPAEHSGNTFQFQDTLHWMVGRHGLKLGFEVKRYQNSEMDDTAGAGMITFNGRYSGSGLADFFLGLPNQFTYAPAIGRIYLRNTLLSGFAQDDWRIRDLTLSLGIRYEYLSWPTERYDRMATSHPQLGMRVIVSSATSQLPGRLDPVSIASFPEGTFITSRQAGVPRSLRFPDRNNFGPHVGFAYRAAGDMVIRGGYGINFVKDSQSVFNDRDASFGLPFRTNRVVVNPQPRTFNILRPFSDSVPKVSDTIESAWYVDPHFELAYVQTWLLNLERRLPFDSVLQVGFVGNHMVHGKQTWNWNQSSTWPNRNDRFDGYTDIVALTSGADSRYNALQAEIRKRFSHGLHWNAGYTWSKTLTNVVDEGGANSIWLHDPAMQWGRSRWDRGHVFTGSFVYEVPFGRGSRWLHSMPRPLDAIIGGWRFSGMVSALSGKPLTIISSLARANLSVDGNVPADRLAEGRIDSPNSGRWFDPSAFAPPPSNRPGNAGYAVLDGPGFMTEDLAIHKNFRIGEAGKLQLRVEAYNAFNHVNLGDPITDVDNWSLLGKILTSGPARRLQVALRIDF